MAGTMACDENKIEMAVLALLYYGSFKHPPTDPRGKPTTGQSPSVFMNKV